MSFAKNYGLMAGGITVIVSLLLYMVGPDKLTSWGSFMPLLIFLGFMIYGGITYRKEIGNFLNFKDALQLTFSIWGIAALLISIFTYILYNWIDPELSTIVKEHAIEQTVSMMETFGAPEDAIDEAVSNIEGQDMEQTIGNVALGYVYYCIFGLFISLIVAAFIRRSKPPFPESSVQ